MFFKIDSNQTQQIENKVMFFNIDSIKTLEIQERTMFFFKIDPHPDLIPGTDPRIL